MAYAELNHARWIVRCPMCPSATYCDGRHQWAIQWGDPLHCVECGADAPVEYPKDRLEIEQMVAGRPVEKQNWTHGETLAHLHGENVAVHFP